MSFQPSRRITLTRSSLPKANGPGACGSRVVGGFGRMLATIQLQLFTCRSRKQEKRSEAFLAAGKRRCAKAATGSPKNITPWREIRRSGALPVCRDARWHRHDERRRSAIPQRVLGRCRGADEISSPVIHIGVAGRESDETARTAADIERMREAPQRRDRAGDRSGRRSCDWYAAIPAPTRRRRGQSTHQRRSWPHHTK